MLRCQACPQSRFVNALCSEHSLGLEHGDIEQLISREGTELLRRLLQGYLDLRARLECKSEEVVGADGVVRRRWWDLPAGMQPLTSCSGR